MNKQVEIKVLTKDNRLINRLILYKVNMLDYSILDDSITIRINSIDKGKVIDIIKELGYKYSINHIDSLNKIKHTLTIHTGIIIGFTLMMIVFILLSNMIFSIEIIGNERVKQSKILKVFNDNGIKIDGFKKNNLKDVEDIILKSFDEISYINLRYKGTRLIVDVKEELKSPPIIKDEEGNIIANYDGIIRRVIVKSGTSLVKAGDTVKKGDILIAPYIIYGEGEEEQRREVLASGEIYAKVYLEERIVVPDKSISLESTGNTSRIIVFGNKKPKSPYKNYDLKVQNMRLFAILPLSYKVYEFIELKEVSHTSTDIKYINNLKNCAYERLNAQLFDGEKVERKWIFAKRLDNMYIISVYYEVERLISGGKLE